MTDKKSSLAPLATFSSSVEVFKKKTAEANAVLEQINARVENAEKGKRGRAS